MRAVVSGERRIKSANRVLEIIELFNNERQSVTVMDVSRALGVPQSSTSELLRVLVQTGYLMRDRRTARSFRPTSRTALLGSWVKPRLFRHGHLLRLMDELEEISGEAVALCSIVGTTLKHLHVVGTRVPRSLCGASEHHPLHSPFGTVILSTVAHEQVRRLVYRLNAEGAPESRVPFEDLAIEFDNIRSRGYALGELAPGLSGLAVLLPHGVDEEQLSIGLICPTDKLRDREEQYARQMRDSISESLCPSSALAAPLNSAGSGIAVRRSASGTSLNRGSIHK